MSGYEIFVAMRREPRYIELRTRRSGTDAAHAEAAAMLRAFDAVGDPEGWLAVYPQFNALREANRVAHTEFHGYVAEYLSDALPARGAA